MRQTPYPFGNPVPRRVRAGLLMAVIIGVTLVISVLAALFEEPATDELVMVTSEAFQRAAEIQTQVAEEEPAPIRRTEAPSAQADDAYTEITQVLAASSSGAWNAYARSLVGKAVEWTGTVASVHSDNEVWVTMREPASGAVPQVALHLLHTASGIEPGQQLTFSGSISRIVVFGRDVLVHIANGQIISYASR